MRPDGTTTRTARRDRSRSRVQHDPQPEEQPERIAPHRDRAAAADQRQRDDGRGRPERQQRDDAAVERVGRDGRAVAAFASRPDSGAAISSAGSRKTSCPTANGGGWSR